jgi:hypothetical protein
MRISSSETQTRAMQTTGRKTQLALAGRSRIAVLLSGARHYGQMDEPQQVGGRVFGLA